MKLSIKAIDKLIFKFLVCTALFLVLVILSGTIIAFATGKAKPGNGMRNIDPEPANLIKTGETFTEYGRLRTLTKPTEGKTNGSPMIVSPWISYDEGDKTFYEELSQKERKIKTVITDYFAEHTKQELLQTNENVIKNTILQNINAQLVLGKIKGLYFSEYIFLD